MRVPIKRVLVIGTSLVLILAGVAALGWLSLTHEPKFYREMVSSPGKQRVATAKRFVAQSLQLRNDIVNEPTWEAIFTDAEVNAWLAEDLVTHFADQLPPEVHEPRVMFETDRVTLAFELDRGPVRSVIWAVARPRVPEPNVLELTVEKIRAGVLPVPADRVLDRIAEYAREHGFEASWKKGDEGFPVATIRYTPNDHRDDVLLERVDIQKGEIRLAGRSDRRRGVVLSPTLPTRKVLQSKFPRRSFQLKAPGMPSPEAETASRSSNAPTS
jgi:hypothetical protein